MALTQNSVLVFLCLLISLSCPGTLLSFLPHYTDVRGRAAHNGSVSGPILVHKSPLPSRRRVQIPPHPPPGTAEFFLRVPCVEGSGLCPLRASLRSNEFPVQSWHTTHYTIHGCSGLRGHTPLTVLLLVHPCLPSSLTHSPVCVSFHTDTSLPFIAGSLPQLPELSFHSQSSNFS